MDNDLTWVDSVIQIATTGGFSALVWYMMVKYIPAIEERHREDRRQWRDSLEQLHAETITRMEAITDDIKAVMNRVEHFNDK